MREVNANIILDVLQPAVERYVSRTLEHVPVVRGDFFINGQPAFAVKGTTITISGVRPIARVRCSCGYQGTGVNQHRGQQRRHARGVFEEEAAEGLRTLALSPEHVADALRRLRDEAA